MYNAELKNQYIKQSKTRNINIEMGVIPMFNKAEKMEIALQKDLKDFTVSEIIDFYNMCCTSSLESLMMINSHFKQYTAYCLARSLVKDNQNHYSEITSELLSTCLNYGLTKAKIITREELESLMSELHNPSDKFILLALFEGICGEEMSELVEIRKEDITGNEIQLASDRILEISKELKSLAYESADEYVYYAYKKDGDIKELYYAKDDPYVIKRMYNADVEASSKIKRQRLYSKVMRIKEYLGSSAIGKKQLMESGRIDMIKQLMKEQNLPVFECIQRNRFEIEYRYGILTSISRYLLKYGEFYEEA